MDSETKNMAKELSDPGFKGIVIGDQVIFPPLAVGEKAFHFDYLQIRFLYALQQCGGNMEEAAARVNRPMEWAQKFIGSRKFRAFRNAKLAAMSVRNGDLVEWWWKYGLDGAKGYREWYEGVCHLCHEKSEFEVAEAEMVRRDDMTFDAKCKVCLQEIEIELKKEGLPRTREQVQFWSELGNRLSPKIERVHHEFSAEKFTFVSEDAA